MIPARAPHIITADTYSHLDHTSLMDAANVIASKLGTSHVPVPTQQPTTGIMMLFMPLLEAYFQMMAEQGAPPEELMQPFLNMITQK